MANGAGDNALTGNGCRMGSDIASLSLLVMGDRLEILMSSF